MAILYWWKSYNSKNFSFDLSSVAVTCKNSLLQDGGKIFPKRKVFLSLNIITQQYLSLKSLKHLKRHASNATTSFRRKLFRECLILKEQCPQQTLDFLLPDFFFFRGSPKSMYLWEKYTLYFLKVNTEHEIQWISIRTLNRIVSNVIKHTGAYFRGNRSHFQLFLLI